MYLKNQQNAINKRIYPAPPFVSYIPNQVLNLSSRYFWPFPFTESNMSLIVLSTNLIKQLASCGCSPCLLALRYLQIVCIVACRAYRRIKVFVGVSLGLDMSSLSAFQSVVKSASKRLPISLLHICLEYRQSKNKWQQDSCSSLHRTQVVLIATFQCCILSAV